MSEQAAVNLFWECCEATDPAEVLAQMDDQDLARTLRLALRLGGQNGVPELVATAAMSVIVERFLTQNL